MVPQLGSGGGTQIHIQALAPSLVLSSDNPTVSPLALCACSVDA